MADPTVGDTIREKREVIVRIAGRHGATQVRLIGSVARGEARPDSDIDLLVTWSEGTSLLAQAALMLELENLLGRKVDIASDGWVKPSIRESVYRDAIALYKSHPAPDPAPEVHRPVSDADGLPWPRQPAPEPVGQDARGDDDEGHQGRAGLGHKGVQHEPDGYGHEEP